MRAHVTRDVLFRALAPMVRCADPDRASMPILANVRLTVHAGELHLHATDLESTVHATLPCVGSDDGASTIPAKLAREIVRSLPPGCTVEISTDDKQWVTLRAEWTRSSGSRGRCEFRVLGNHAANFPKVPDVDAVTWTEIAPAPLRDALASVFPAISTDPTRACLRQVHLASDGRVIRALATDGHRLAQAEGATGGPVCEVNVPRAGVARMMEVLDGADTCEIAIGDGHLHLRTPDGILSVKLSDVEFPPHAAHVAGKRIADRAHRIVVDRKALQAELRALRRSSIGMRRTGFQGVVLGWGSHGVRLTVEDPDLGDFRRDLAGTTSTSGAVALNARYLADALASVDGETVTIGVDGVLDPVFLMGAGQPIVLMPMKLDVRPHHVPQAQLGAPEAAEPAPAPAPLAIPETPAMVETAEPVFEESVLVDPLDMIMGAGGATAEQRQNAETGSPACEARSVPPAPAPELAPVVPIERARTKKRFTALARRPVVALEVPEGETWTPCEKPGRCVRAGHPFGEDGARVCYYTDAAHARDWVCVHRGDMERWYEVTLPLRYRRGVRSNSH